MATEIQSLRKALFGLVVAVIFAAGLSQSVVYASICCTSCSCGIQLCCSGDGCPGTGGESCGPYNTGCYAYCIGEQGQLTNWGDWWCSEYCQV